MADNLLKQNTIVNGSSVVQTYLRDGVNLPVHGVEEYITIETGPIAANTSKILNLSDYGHVFKLESLWVDMATSTNLAIEFEVLWGTNIIFTFTLNSNQIPFSFPPIILTNTLNVRIKPQQNIDRMLCYGKPVAIINRLIFP